MSDPVTRVSDSAAAWLRTVWPVLVGHVAGWLVAWLAARTGVRVDEGWMVEALGLAGTAVVYGAGRWLEARRGPGVVAVAARWLGRLLLSAGVATGRPVYIPESAESARPR